MKKIILLHFFAFIITSFSYAQVGIGTQNPQGVFNIDGAKDNATTGAPTTTQQRNDFVVLANGKVGIGTTAPTSNLEVIANDNSSYVNAASFYAPSNITAGNATLLNFGTSASSGNSGQFRFIYNGANATTNRVDFGMNDYITPFMTYTRLGNVGIGTTTPVTRLEVYSTTADLSTGGAGTLRIYNPTTATANNFAGVQFKSSPGNSSWKIGANQDSATDTDQSFYFLNSHIGSAFGSKMMIKGGTGNVGIGTTSPSNRLHVVGNALFAPKTANDGAGGEPMSVEIYGKSPAGTGSQVGGIKMGWYGATGGIEILRGGGSYGVGLGFNVSPNISGSSTFEAMRIMFDGKVGIGTTAPSEILDVVGNVKFSGALLPNNISGSTGQFLTSAGSSAAPTWTTLTAANTPNIYTADGTVTANRTVTHSDKNITFSGTTGNLIYNPSSTGKMGIGTAAPASKLHVNTDLAATNTINADATMLRLSRPTTAAVKWDNIAQFNLGSYALGGAGTYEAYSRMDLALNDGATTSTNNVMTWQGNGNIGVGTTTPTQKLQVFGGNVEIGGSASQTGSVANPMLRIHSNSNTSGSGGLIEFNEDSLDWGYTLKHNTADGTYGNEGLWFERKLNNVYTPRFGFNNIGNVGIGTTTPTSRLTVGAGTGYEEIAVNSGGTANAGVRLNQGGTNGKSYVIYSTGSAGNGGAGNLDFLDSSSNISRLFINSSGNVGVGTKAPTSKLEVNGAATNTHVADVTGTTIDFSLSNVMGTTASAGAFTLQNLKSGGSYTLAVKGTTSGTCTFTASGFTVHLPSDNGATTAAKHSLYNFLVVGTDVYVSWVTGL